MDEKKRIVKADTPLKDLFVLSVGYWIHLENYSEVRTGTYALDYEENLAEKLDILLGREDLTSLVIDISSFPDWKENHADIYRRLRKQVEAEHPYQDVGPSEEPPWMSDPIPF